MAASITDLFTGTTNSTRPVAVKTTATRSTGGTALTTEALTGWETGSAVHFATYKVDTAGKRVAGSQNDWKGIVASSTSITNLVLKAGIDNGNAIGDTVEAMPTAAWADDLANGLQVEHNKDGTHSAITTTSITNAGNISQTDGSSINDNSSNELIKFAKTASAVNEVTVTNASTGNAPQVNATGSDANVHLQLGGKGTGGVLTKNPYKFSVYRAAALNSSTTLTVVPFDTKTFDTGSNVDVVTNKGRFTSPVAGYYFFTAALGNAAATNTTMAIALMKNGVIYKYGNVYNSPNANNKETVTAIIPLAANDYIEVGFLGGGGSVITVGAQDCWFDGYLIST